MSPMDKHRRATDVLAPILAAFFEATLRGKPPATRLNVRPTDFFVGAAGRPNFPVAPVPPAAL